MRVGGKTVAKGKVRVNIYLDAEVVEYFKAAAGGVSDTHQQGVERKYTSPGD